jgi:hypothetical protein
LRDREKMLCTGCGEEMEVFEGWDKCMRCHVPQRKGESEAGYRKRCGQHFRRQGGER